MCRDVLVTSYYNSMRNDKHHRFLSWEHCYNFFRSITKDKNNSKYGKDIIDMACLHLGFYLASWGMYRGSSFLLQKDYRVHEIAVEEIFKPKYDIIRDVRIDKLEILQKNVSLIFDLLGDIKTRAYKDYGNVTDTLASKILLGTVGCVPAYDRYFIKGLRATDELTFSGLKLANFKKLLYWSIDNKDKLPEKTYHSGYLGKYPAMKIVDMYFWKLGEKLS